MAQMIEQIPSLRRYARALVGDRSRADDLVQDCLERAWSRAHLFRPGEDVRVWLFTILHNLHVSSIRRRRRQPRLVPLVDGAPDPAMREGQESAAEMADLAWALEQLPPDQCSAVLLVGLEDMTYRQAAAVLGIPVGTLMSRLYRGRQRLRALIEGEVSVHLKRAK
ncbi:MAG: sigma-70 family RNA polymerase sigma factor [Alphaproteobacteria bacterium]|nr:MAG: sigma-70 family RNA polymerase sigma factor [Alphaproteobacteria bacterium]